MPMPDTPPPSDPAAVAPAVDALLLVNLGTPSAPTARAVRRYLAEFLHDHRVVQLTRWLWCPLLHFMILPLRSPRVAHKYAEIWMDGGSPLAVHTRQLTDAVRQQLPGVRVAHAMRYGEPALPATLRELAAAGAERVLVLPLYPQYSTTTTASVADVVARETNLSEWPDPWLEAQAARTRKRHPHKEPATGIGSRMIQHYATDPNWTVAIADSIRAHWAAQGRGEKLLFSFHGIPQRLADAGDPYPDQCRASVAAIVAALDLAPQDYVLTFQSRFGREPWLRPATDATLHALAAEGITRIDVVCPGFAVDCLETLEEIAMQNAELFRAEAHRAAARRQPPAPGPQPPALRYIPCLNATPAHADALAALARQAFAAWPAASR
jgi:ferrochelatase